MWPPTDGTSDANSPARQSRRSARRVCGFAARRVVEWSALRVFGGCWVVIYVTIALGSRGSRARSKPRVQPESTRRPVTRCELQVASCELPVERQQRITIGLDWSRVGLVSGRALEIRLFVGRVALGSNAQACGCSSRGLVIEIPASTSDSDSGCNLPNRISNRVRVRARARWRCWRCCSCVVAVAVAVGLAACTCCSQTRLECPLQTILQLGSDANSLHNCSLGERPQKRPNRRSRADVKRRPRNKTLRVAPTT